MPNLQIAILILFLVSTGCIDKNEDISSYSQKFKTAIISGTILDEKLYEASGLVASRINKGMLWTINDSGNDARLFLIDNKGNTIHSYWIDKATNIDWEDLTIYTDDTGKSKIYIGDIGDNYTIRKNINIIVLDEPIFGDPNDTIITNYKNYQFKYPDGAKDAETIMLDPLTSTLFVITKREENVRIYEAPMMSNISDTLDLIFKKALPFYNVTSGDVTANGEEILLKSYDSIYYWKRTEDETILEAMTRDHVILDYSPEPQGESIAWSVDNNGFFTLSEKRGPGDQVLYFYERNNE